MKTAISLPDPLFASAEQLAKRLHVTRSELYARALRAYVLEHDDADKRRALDALYVAEPSELPTGAQRAQARILSEWDDP